MESAPGFLCWFGTVVPGLAHSSIRRAAEIVGAFVQVSQRCFTVSMSKIDGLCKRADPYTLDASARTRSIPSCLARNSL